MYQIHAELKIGKEMVSKFEPVAFSVRLPSSGMYEEPSMRMCSYWSLVGFCCIFLNFL